MTEDEEKIAAIDITLAGVYSSGIAYYRIPPDMRDFLTRCRETHRVIGFEYTWGELNFGVILAPQEASGG